MYDDDELKASIPIAVPAAGKPVPAPTRITEFLDALETVNPVDGVT
jgi:hypothetical protein